MFVSEGRSLFLEDLKKIRTMISLAVYDKHYGEKDRRITSKYRRDYVYLRGLGMRIGVAMGFFVSAMLISFSMQRAGYMTISHMPALQILL